MRIFKQYQHLSDLGPHVVVLGNFDGIHCGHQVLIQTALHHAALQQCDSLVMSFDPHPLRFFKGDDGPKSLYSALDRSQMFLHMGIDKVLLQTFEHSFASLSPEQFFKEILVQSLQASVIIVGYDFAFGEKRAGRVEHLITWGKTHDISVIVIEAQHTHHQETPKVYSSTWIRALITQGEVQQAALALGRDYHVRGEVVEGYQRGRLLGFPTANIALNSEICPMAGVYAGYMDWGNGAQRAVISIGSNPTFQEQHKLLANQQWSFEVHVLSQNHDLYHKSVIVWMTHYIRSPQKFSHVDELKQQITHDCQKSMMLLSKYSIPTWPFL